MPHEAKVRAWLKRSLVSPEDMDDLIQEAYSKLAKVEAYEQIAQPDGYFFGIVRNLLTDQRRRARVVRIDTVGNLSALNVASDEASPERVVAAKRELQRIRKLIAELPPRCRQIFELRKIEGVPQREIARRLKLTESVVENEGVKGMRLILKALADEQRETSRIVQSEEYDRSRNPR